MVYPDFLYHIAILQDLRVFNTSANRRYVLLNTTFLFNCFYKQYEKLFLWISKISYYGLSSVVRYNFFSFYRFCSILSQFYHINTNDINYGKQMLFSAYLIYLMFSYFKKTLQMTEIIKITEKRKFQRLNFLYKKNKKWQ